MSQYERKHKRVTLRYDNRYPSDAPDARGNVNTKQTNGLEHRAVVKSPGIIYPSAGQFRGLHKQGTRFAVPHKPGPSQTKCTVGVARTNLSIGRFRHARK